LIRFGIRSASKSRCSTRTVRLARKGKFERKLVRLERGAALDVLALVNLDNVRNILPQDCDAIYEAAERELCEIADLLA
jgi:hypothetical protein